MTATIQKETKRTTVLVVDDEPLLLEVVRMMIERLGFAALIAADGSEGLKLVEKHRQEIFLVLCDLIMPGLDGWQTITALRLLAPELRVVLVSGNAVTEAMCKEHPDRPWMVLHKPYMYDVLDNLLQRAQKEAASNACENVSQYQ